MQKLLSFMRSCVDDYKMISPGEKIAIGVSGGKDSIALLRLMAELKNFYPGSFELIAITLDLGFPGMDFSPVAKLCEELGIPYYIRKTNIAEIVFDIRKETNPCSLCAKMRRGALYDEAIKLGCRKVAMGHHFDDAVETYFMSLIFEGRIYCFEPVTWLDRREVTLIRPMLYIHEKKIESFVNRYELPIVHNKCPADKNTRREEIKKLIYELEGRYPELRERIMGGMQRLPLGGWGKKK